MRNIGSKTLPGSLSRNVRIIFITKLMIVAVILEKYGKKGLARRFFAIPQIGSISLFQSFFVFSSESVRMHVSTLLLKVAAVLFVVSLAVQFLVNADSECVFLVPSRSTPISSLRLALFSLTKSFRGWLNSILPDLPDTSLYKPYDTSDMIQNLYPGRINGCV